MNTDSLLHSLCDISGSCLLYREKIVIKDRPYCTVTVGELLGIKKPRGSIARCLLLRKWPDIDPNTCVVLKCNERTCIAWEHIERGVVNLSMKKTS